MRDRTRVCVLGVVLALELVASSAHAQILDRAASAVRGQSSSSSSSSGSSARDDDDDDDDDYRSSSSDHDRRGRRSRGGYSSGGADFSLGLGRGARSSCPYDDGWYGVDGVDEAGDPGSSGSAGSLRLEAEVGYAIAGAARAALGARAQLAWIGLVVRYSGLLDPGGAEVRGALLGRVGIELWLVDEPGGQLRLGGGVRHWHDANGSVGGADMTVSFDVFPGDPFVLSGELGAGLLGDAFVLLARAELGAMLGSTQLFAGYHYEALVNGPIYADLGGPMLGVRAWL